MTYVTNIYNIHAIHRASMGVANCDISLSFFIEFIGLKNDQTGPILVSGRYLRTPRKWVASIGISGGKFSRYSGRTQAKPRQDRKISNTCLVVRVANIILCWPNDLVEVWL